MVCLCCAGLAGNVPGRLFHRHRCFFLSILLTDFCIDKQSFFLLCRRIEVRAFWMFSVGKNLGWVVGGGKKHLCRRHAWKLRVLLGTERSVSEDRHQGAHHHVYSGGVLRVHRDACQQTCMEKGINRHTEKSMSVGLHREGC